MEKGLRPGQPEEKPTRRRLELSITTIQDLIIKVGMTEREAEVFMAHSGNQNEPLLRLNQGFFGVQARGFDKLGRFIAAIIKANSESSN